MVKLIVLILSSLQILPSKARVHTEIGTNSNAMSLRTTRSNNLRYAWVTQSGYNFTYQDNVPAVEVATTNSVPYEAFEKGSRLIHLMVRFMPRWLFTDITKYVSVGIFSSQELPSAFPEYDPGFDNSQCLYRCPDSCAKYCDNHRPINLLWSYPGKRTVVPAGNVLCGPHHHKDQYDPEMGNVNLLVQAFAETLYRFALPKNITSKTEELYHRSKRTWNIYPSNAINYFRQATLTWFQATRKSGTVTGGMNMCSQTNMCTNEWEHRNNIRTKDLELYNLLSEIYNNGHNNLEGRISVCTW